MEEFNFKNSELTQYMQEQTGKSTFTEDEAIDYLTNKTIDLKGSKITQKDINILDWLFNKINIKNGDISELDLSKRQYGTINLIQCKIPKDFFKNATINTIIIDACKTQTNIGQELSKINDLTELSIIASQKETLDISFLENLQEIQSLSLTNFDIKPTTINILEHLENLRILELNNIRLSQEIIFPKMKKLKDLKIDGSIQTLKSIKNLTQIDELEILSNDKQHVDLEELKNFTELTYLSINGIEGIYENLPETMNIETLVLKNCGLHKIKKIHQMYPLLSMLSVEENPLDQVSIKDVAEIRRDGIIFSFENSQFEEKMKKAVITVEDKDLEKRVKEFLDIEENLAVNVYSILTAYRQRNAYIEGLDLFAVLVNLEKIGYIFPRQNILGIDNFDILFKYSDIIQDLQKHINKFLLSSIQGLDRQKLDTLGKNKRYGLKEDLMTAEHWRKGYTKEDMEEMLDVLELIKSEIPTDADDYTKFEIIYEFIINGVVYDDSGCKENENFTKENEEITRSLKGALVEGRAVCAGFALVLEQCLKYIGVEAKEVYGYAYGNEKWGHAWNQIKINGNWYNADPTWDASLKRKGQELRFFLVSDEKFYKDHTVVSEAYRCNKDYKQIENANFKNMQNKEEQDEER